MSKESGDNGAIASIIADAERVIQKEEKAVKVLTKPEKPENPRDFRSWGTYNRKETRFRVRDHTGRSRTIHFSTVLLTDFIRPNQFFILCKPFVIILEGDFREEHLEELEEEIRAETLVYLQAYNSKLFDAPDDKRPIIRKIEFRWFKGDPIEALVQEFLKEEEMETVS